MVYRGIREADVPEMRLSKHIDKVIFFFILMSALSSSHAVEKKVENKVESKTGTNIKQNIVLSSMPVKPLADKLAGAPFVFIGENHTVYSNHVKQLEIIKALYEKNKNIAIGMEMFSNASNKIIADYIREKISEADLLTQSDYFQEWGYDFHYYKDILDFARKNKVDVVGLNIKNDIVRKIGKAGFRDITPEELAQIPDQIDFSNESYKKSLNEVFHYHPDYQNKLPDNFYLSQLIRDESMAQSASRYIKENPEKTMILLVGIGHVEFGYGIPQRLRRITGKPNKTILLDSPFKPDAADYFVYTNPIKMKTSPRLKVMISSENEKITVTGFTDADNAAKHALKEKDEILTINNVSIHSIVDIRLFLYDKQPGDIINIAIVRDKQPMTVKYTLEANDDDEE
jgi:uncharacterized iron-regulated protein